VGTVNSISIAHNGKLFVSASSTNAISWSYDAINWTSLGDNSIFNGAISQIKWMGDRFIALGTGTTSRIATSKDGIRWTVLNNINTVFSTAAYCVETDAHGLHKIKFPDSIVFTGKSYSRDGGVTWTTINGMSSAASTVAFNGKQFIFTMDMEQKTYVSESINGPKTQINIVDLSVNTIQWNGNYWLMGGGSNTGSYLLKSADGYNWTKIESSAFSNGFICFGLAWNGKLWVASGTTDTSTLLAYSLDGVNWSSASTVLGGGVVEWNGSYFLCGGPDSLITDTNISISSDGKTWVSQNIGAYGSVSGIAWSGKSWVIVTSSRILYSENGNTWIPANITGYVYFSVVWAGTNYIASATNGSLNVIPFYSYDGLNWLVGTGSELSRNISWTKSNEAVFSAKSPNIIGGTGTQNTMLYSSDGVVFRGLGKSTFTTSCRTVAWNGDIWVAGGEGTNTLAYSYDGKNWTGLGTSVFSSCCYKVISNGTVWVAMGSGTNTIATSTDGMNWIGLGTSIFDGSGIGIDWNGKQWLAVGSGTQNTLAMSNNAMANSWTGLGNTLFSGMHCVKWMLSAWFVGADASGTSTIASSSNGTTWTYVNTDLNSSCHSISWNGREAIAGGIGTSTLIRTIDGMGWSSISTNGITGVYGIEWNENKWTISANGTYQIYSLVGTTLFRSSSGMLSQGYCVGANSGIGSTVFNNRVYLNAGYKLVIYGPEYYDSMLTSDTSISMNMNLPL
jgi:hypothetical protein